jgi:hypothetical protein
MFLWYAKPIVVMVLTAALCCSGEIKAEPLDRLVEEGVQILKEKHEVVHLQIMRQLDVRQAQEKLLASRQRWDQYTRKLPPQKQAAILDRIKKRDAMVLADLRRKWAAEGLQLQK